MAIQTERNYLGDLVKRESDLGNEFSREKITVLDGQSLSMGSVIGKITKSVPATGTAGAGHTGTGTCTLVTGGPKTQLGSYTLVATAATAFSVKAPDGTGLPDAATGEAYENEQINFTLASGGVAFVAGDTFTITVSAGSGKAKAIDFSAVDGSGDACGISIDEYAPSGSDMPGAAVVRDAVIDPAYLVWPAGATAPQKSAALAQLKALGILSDRVAA